jgi:group I intron endonuclease
MVINKALLKYGHENFSLTILEYCDIETVIEREQSYFDALNPEYNVLPLAGSRGGYRHTAESRLKMSEARKGKPGNPHSEGSKAKLSEAGINNTNRVGKIHTKEQRAKISAGQPTSQRVEVLDLLENTINQYSSIREVSKSIGCSRYAVSNSLENKKVLKERYIIRPCV